VPQGEWDVRVDTGGTFTDCVARSPGGDRIAVKVLSTGAIRARMDRVEPQGRIHLKDLAGPEPKLLEGLTLHQRRTGAPLGRIRHGTRTGDTLQLTLDESQTRQEALQEGELVELRSPEPAPILATRLVTGTALHAPLPKNLRLRLATTRATNALLERKGAPAALFLTQGFGDTLRIGDQTRPRLFALDVARPPPLVDQVVEVEERVSSEGEVLTPLALDPPPPSLRRQVARLRAEGIESAAVTLLHAHRNPAHEEALGRFLREQGFSFVALSSQVAPFTHLLRRTETTTVEAYLGPILHDYLQEILDAIPGSRLLVMTSTGGLTRAKQVRARETLLSGPAGGVLGAAHIARLAGVDPVISLDMGGTSTDVSRHHGSPEVVEEHQVGPARLKTPAVAVETVAAGGGSICRVERGVPSVGPESAGAEPGPACYGAGGPLTLTDVNLLLGRLPQGQTQLPLDRSPALKRAQGLRDQLAAETASDPSLEELLAGFLELANQRMTQAIRRTSVRKGYDPADHYLVAFGGAGPQHACALAHALQMKGVLIPAEAGVLSAVGLDVAPVEKVERAEILQPLPEAIRAVQEAREILEQQAREEVARTGVPHRETRIREAVAHLRLLGQESTLAIPLPDSTTPGPTDPATGGPSAGGGTHPATWLQEAFREVYRQTFGHEPRDHPIEVESIRVTATGSVHLPLPLPQPSLRSLPPAADQHRLWGRGRWHQVPVHNRDDLPPGARVPGPALLRARHATVVVEEGWTGEVLADGTLRLTSTPTSQPPTWSQGASNGLPASPAIRSGAIHRELFVQRFRGVVGEMGAQLRRTALSVNIREREDFSCALLDAQGRLVVNAPHIPVHLGALGACVRSVARELALGPGDVAVTNHPGFGGSHLPDVTVITPLFAEGTTEASTPPLLGFVANRAHHAEIGGIRPGSMPPESRRLIEEGVVIPPQHLVRGGVDQWDRIQDLLSQGPHPSRAVEDNLADLAAQVAANHRGAGLVADLIRTHGAQTLTEQMEHLRRRAARRAREVILKLEDGIHRATEELDDGTLLSVSIQVKGASATFDFTGSGPVHPGNLNATPAIVRSGVLYLLRILAGQELPLNEGLLDPIRIHLPPGLLNPPLHLSPQDAPAVVGGNVETSQRLVDTLLKPFQLLGAGQGTMNNLLFGDERLSYYETIGGGAGAGRGFHGASGTQVHMTNTRITDVEVLEHRFPVRVEAFRLRSGSGGQGRWTGGDGLVRALRFLRPLCLSLLAQHRRVRPYGAAGGEAGAPGRQWIIGAAGDRVELEGAAQVEVEQGDLLVVETPGGGGWGRPTQGPDCL